jgi:hypothetical protein
LKPSPAFSPAPSGATRAVTDSERFRHALQQFWLNQPGNPDAERRDTAASPDQSATHRPRASTQAL